MDTKQNAVVSGSATRGQVVREDSSHPEHLEGSSSAEIKERIDRTRGAMDSTLNQLGERLSPHSLLDDAIAWFKSSSAQSSAHQLKSNVEVFGKNLGSQIRDNPLPTLLVGAGLAWMAIGSSSNHSDDVDDDDDALAYADDHRFTTEEEMLIGGYGTAARSHAAAGQSPAGLYLPNSAKDGPGGASMTDKAKQTGASVASSLQHAASSTTESLHDAATAVGERVSDATVATARAVRGAAASIGSALGAAGDATQDMAHHGYSKSRDATRGAYKGTVRSSQRAGRKVQRAGQQFGRRSSEQVAEAYEAGREKLREAHEDYPLALGFGFLALGALAGLAIPRTRREDELLGETADQVRESAWEAGEEVVTRGKEAMDHTVSTARQAAEEQGLTPDNLADSASRVIEKTANTLNKAAKEEGIHPQQLSEQTKEVADKTQETAKKEVSK